VLYHDKLLLKQLLGKSFEVLIAFECLLWVICLEVCTYPTAKYIINDNFDSNQKMKGLDVKFSL
jgi:hypothetical protein